MTHIGEFKSAWLPCASRAPTFVTEQSRVATNVFDGEMLTDVALVSKLDLVTSAIGAIICTVFVYYEGTKGDRRSPFPWEQTLGMAFNALICPLLMLINRRFYEKWRHLIIILIRISFMIGTSHNYDDLPRESFEYV